MFIITRIAHVLNKCCCFLFFYFCVCFKQEQRFKHLKRFNIFCRPFFNKAKSEWQWHICYLHNCILDFFFFKYSQSQIFLNEITTDKEPFLYLSSEISQGNYDVFAQRVEKKKLQTATEIKLKGKAKSW